MARITSPGQVRYLALEGGGGKGVTYLGAIRQLERLGVLPINIDTPGQNQIKGISGASAGAITAMFLAMGYTSAELEQVLSNQSTFTGFFDGPAIGLSRLVSRDNRPEMRTDAPPGVGLIDYHKQQRLRISGISRLASSLALIARQANSGSDPIVARLIAQPDAYLFNFIFERGLFPGFAPRRFLQGAIYSRLWGRYIWKYSIPGQMEIDAPWNGSELNFLNFHKLTGVDLVITGANVTKHKPAVFSSRHTPLFPVAEAVGISMNLPFLFKPVHVEANVPVGPLNSRADDYHGMWIDGGVLNNFPLHAFDHLMPPVSAAYPGLRPLNPAMLGLRLTEGPATHGPSPPPERFDILLEHMANIMGTVFYPSEEGQIRNEDERSQTIDLYTYDLSTTDFAPPPSRSATPIAEAERAVKRYFGI